MTLNDLMQIVELCLISLANRTLSSTNKHRTECAGVDSGARPKSHEQGGAGLNRLQSCGMGKSTEQASRGSALQVGRDGWRKGEGQKEVAAVGALARRPTPVHLSPFFSTKGRFYKLNK